MNKKNKLQKILKVMTPDDTAVDFKVFDEQVANLKNQLKEKITVKTLDEVNTQIDNFRKRIDLEPLLETMHKIEDKFSNQRDEIINDIESKYQELTSTDIENDTASNNRAVELGVEIDDLKAQLSSLEVVRKNDINSFSNKIEEVKKIETLLDEFKLATAKNIQDLQDKDEQDDKEASKKLTGVQTSLETLRKDVMQRINNIGGGAMNRQMYIGGVDPLTRYTDMNLKAGSNVTITYANNDQTKQVDVTISSSGGGGGAVRSINSISVSTAAGSTSGTDYVYLCSGTLTLTLPDATTNTNLYTIKNVGTGVVTIATTSSQTIDGNLTIQMATQFTSVDVISDTANWNIT